MIYFTHNPMRHRVIGSVACALVIVVLMVFILDGSGHRAHVSNAKLDKDKFSQIIKIEPKKIKQATPPSRATKESKPKIKSPKSTTQESKPKIKSSKPTTQEPKPKTKSSKPVLAVKPSKQPTTTQQEIDPSHIQPVVRPDSSLAPTAKISPKPLPVKLAPTSLAKKWYIQVASYSQKANADRRLAKIRQDFSLAFIETTSIDQTKYYRVKLGPYADQEATLNVVERLKKFGFNEVQVLAP